MEEISSSSSSSSSSQPLLYKQVMTETTFTIPCQGDRPLSIYFLHNQWIGMDNEVHLFNSQSSASSSSISNSTEINSSNFQSASNPNSKGKGKGKRCKSTKNLPSQQDQSIPQMVAEKRRKKSNAHTKDMDDLLQYISHEERMPAEELRNIEHPSIHASNPIYPSASPLPSSHSNQHPQLQEHPTEGHSTDIDIDNFLQTLFC